MGRCLAIAAVGLVFGQAAAAASADYVRVADVRPDDDLAVAGDSVLVGATPEGGISTLNAHGFDGTVRPITIPAPARFVEEVNASRTALSVLTIPAGGGRLRAYFAPTGGPLTRIPRSWIDVAVTGDTVVSLHDRGYHGPVRLELRDVHTGTRRRIGVPGRRVGVVTAAGHYAAYTANFASQREVTIVVDLRTGRELYRVRNPRNSSTYGLAPTGRLWFLIRIRASGRVLTATRRRPRPRTVARLPLHPHELAVTRTEIAVIRDSGAGTGRVVLIRSSGERRVVTPTLPADSALAYDGATLAFSAGTCVFAGPIPTVAPAPIALAGCSPPAGIASHG